jgi:RNA polymerase sigma-70 factor (ECF subfamily)
MHKAVVARRDSWMTSDDRLQRDRLLRSAVLSGDERAWQTWYEETFDELYRYVHWRCAGQQDRTEEVVQETWLTAVRRLRRFDPARGSFGVWLRGIAGKVLCNHLRRHQRTRKHQRPLSSEPVAPESTKSLESRERAQRIAVTLSALPRRHEDALRAKYLDNLSVAEIAASWEETCKTVESLLSRARQKFRETYHTLEQGPEHEKS